VFDGWQRLRKKSEKGKQKQVCAKRGERFGFDISYLSEEQQLWWLQVLAFDCG
jgi:hypothetical protein